MCISEDFYFCRRWSGVNNCIFLYNCMSKSHWSWFRTVTSFENVLFLPCKCCFFTTRTYVHHSQAIVMFVWKAPVMTVSYLCRVGRGGLSEVCCPSMDWAFEVNMYSSDLGSESPRLATLFIFASAVICFKDREGMACLFLFPTALLAAHSEHASPPLLPFLPTTFASLLLLPLSSPIHFFTFTPVLFFSSLFHFFYTPPFLLFSYVFVS